MKNSLSLYVPIWIVSIFNYSYKYTFFLSKTAVKNNIVIQINVNKKKIEKNNI